MAERLKAPAPEWRLKGGPNEKEIQADLDRLFADQDQRTARLGQQKAEREQSERNFIKGFTDLRQKVIEPAMYEIGRYIQAKDRNYRVTSTEDGRSVTFIFSSDPDLPDVLAPSVIFTAVPAKQKVAIENSSASAPRRRVQSTVRSSRPRPAKPRKSEYSLSEVTTDLVQQEIHLLIAASPR